jgi:hypothetical protein
MTVALWFQILSGGEFQRLFTNDNIAQDAANVGEYFSLIYDTTGNFSEAGPGLHVTARRSGPNASGKRLLKSALNLEDGLWHHVVVAGDGTGVISTFVVDGVDVLGSTVTAVQNLSHPPQARIGSRDGGAAANTFNGHIDDIAVWLGTQLSVGQAQSLYNAALIPEPASAILMLFGLSALGIFRRRARAIGVRR